MSTILTTHSTTSQKLQLRPSGFKGNHAHRTNWLLKNCTWRVRVLIAVNEARRVLDIFENRHPEDKRPREAIEVATKVVDGDAAYAAYAAANAAYAAYAAYAAANAAYAAANAANAANAAHAAANAAYAAANAANAAYAANASYAAAYAAYAAANAAYAAANAEFLENQDRRMSLYIPVENLTELPLAWFTETTTSLAETMYTEQDWSLAPILADSLMDAGCEHEEIIGILRDHWEDFGRGVWIIDQLTGRK